MAKILYGVCGIGAGHYVRSKILIEHLSKDNEVFILGGLSAYGYLKEYFKNVYWIEGLEFAFKDNKVLSLGTILKNIKKISKKNYDLLKKVKAKIDKFEPDLVISDFEPFSIYYGKENKIKTISFDNEHYINEGEFSFPKEYKLDYLKTKFIINFYKSDNLVVYLLPGQKLRNESNAKIVLSLVRDSILKSKSKKGDYILVYTSIVNYHGLFEVLKKFDEKFIIFGLQDNKVDKNLVFRTFSNTEFDKALVNCKAVITSGGINLISEALYLKKPLLVIPIKNHFEQILNSLFVKENGYGEMYEDLSEDNLKGFLNNLDKYKTINYVPGNKHLFKIVDKIIEGVKK